MGSSRRGGASIASAGVILAVVATGCLPSYKVRTEEVRDLYEASAPEDALRHLEEAEDAGRLDRLLVLLDRGMLLHVAGRYEESIAALKEAERLSEARETVFLRDEAGSGKLYRTSEVEKQLISVTQAMSFAALGDHESALVEVRRIDERLRRLSGEGRPYWDRLAIARYLGGLLYEQVGDLDAAFIDYAKAHEIGPNPALGEPLVRLSRLLGRHEEHARMRANYPGASGEEMGIDEGEVVVLIAAGLSPERAIQSREVGPPEDRRTEEYLDYAPRPWRRESATVSIAGNTVSATTISSLEEIVVQRGALGWIEDTERRGTFLATWGHLLLFCLCPPVGLVTTTVHAADKTVMALQTWLSLPAEYQVARLRLPPGDHEIAVGLGDEIHRRAITVSPGGLILVSARLYGVSEGLRPE
jgi:uncharacterized protein